MPRANGMVCYFCAGVVDNPEHIALDEEDELVCMCDHCYKLAEKFFKKETDKHGKHNDT